MFLLSLVVSSVQLSPSSTLSLQWPLYVLSAITVFVVVVVASRIHGGYVGLLLLVEVPVEAPGRVVGRVAPAEGVVAVHVGDVTWNKEVLFESHHIVDASTASECIMRLTCGCLTYRRCLCPR